MIHSVFSSLNGQFENVGATVNATTLINPDVPTDPPTPVPSTSTEVPSTTTTTEPAAAQVGDSSSNAYTTIIIIVVIIVALLAIMTIVAVVRNSLERCKVILCIQCSSIFLPLFFSIQDLFLTSSKTDYGSSGRGDGRHNISR
jgi:hypothetical protein